MYLENFLLASTGPITYFTQSNFAGKAIIFILIGMSLVGLAGFITKSIELRNNYIQNRKFEEHFNSLRNMLEITDWKNYANRGPFSKLFSEAIKAYHHPNFDGSEALVVGEARIGMVENALQRGVAYQVHGYESRMILFATISSGAPFFGLLGTAWGVMDAFGSIGLQSNVTLQVLAPGVSGSLLTTVVGLCVAIPSTFGYNYLTSKLKRNITEIENFASVIADRYQREHQLII